MGADRQLRIRLEGRLETLERAAAQLDRLLGLARRGWEAQPLGLIEALEAWAKGASDRLEAVQGVGREPGAARWLAAVRRREGALRARLDRLLAGTAAVRRRSLDQKLGVWAELARSLGPHEAGEPLATGEGVQRSREWMVTLGAAGAVVALGQPLLALLLLPIGVVWWDFCKSTVRWRMFKECLELAEPERPVRRVPLDSIEELDGNRLRGLWDLSLRGESGFLELAADLRRAVTAQKARARYGSAAARALWVPGSLHPTEPPEAVATAKAARTGPPSRPIHGWLLSCERGLLFVPDAAASLAWYVVTGAPPLEAQLDIGAELRALPERLLEEKVLELRKLKGCLWLGGLAHTAYQSLGEILMVVVDSERRLFVRCPHETQAKLLERVRQALG